MSEDKKTLVMLIGPPAVGKMAVGRELERLTGLPLLHNHMTIELVLPFFEFGTKPFNDLVGLFRRRIVEEVAESDLPGLLFTYVWAFDEPGEREYVEKMTGAFADRGARIVFVELEAALETRVERNGSPQRLREKPSKRNVEESTARLVRMDRRYRLNSDGDFPFPNHVVIDTTDLPPVDVAERVIRTFDLPRSDEGDGGASP